MASTSGPLVSPLSPAIKRSTRKRQRPSFFAEEIEAPAAAPSTLTRKHTTRTTRQRQSLHHQATRTPQSHEPNTKRPRSELAQLHDTVSDLRAQIESAATQMQELRSLVGMLADLYRAEQDADEEEDLFSAPLSPLLP